jgi:signal transduction histidine kinase/ActR/RegA family two-component response regulator
MFDVRFRIRGADGRHRWFRTRAVALRDERGAVARWFGTNTDVDDQVRAADALAEADRRKGEFLGILSHELRNPLAPIRNALLLLDRAPAGSAQAARAREVLERQTLHLARLVDDLLDVTRISRGKIELSPERLDVADVVRRTCEDHRPLFEERGVALAVELPSEPAWADADPVRLAQIVGNLLLNAARFTPGGGSATAAVARVGERVAIRVRDTGAGIDPELLPRVFEPFVQAQRGLARTEGGLGLGLALVKGLAEQHGGAVRAASAGRDRGTEVVVELPAAPPPAADRGGAAGAGGARPLVVLVVEDNEDAARTLAEVLEIGGHRVHVALRGREGIALAREVVPDLVLCDIGLPDVTGFEVARALRAEPALRATRVVALSGYAQPEDRARAAEAGFHAHVAKPPTLDALEALLASVAADRGAAR